MNRQLKIGMIGLGLIGGSIAKTIRKYFPDCNIIAYDKEPATLQLALSEGIITSASSTINHHFAACDYIFLCTPVSSNTEHLAAVLPYLEEHTILTDVGSVKENIHTAVALAGGSRYFIGAHPMTGSEKSGYRNSSDHLLENTFYILTPSEDVSKDKVSRYEQFIKELYAIPIILSYDKHDYVTASISHLPHIIAACLVNFVKEHDDAQGFMKLIAAGGFKDITRIASSSPEMWTQICLTNKVNISILIDDYISQFSAFQKYLSASDENRIFQHFSDAREYRNSFEERSVGPLTRIYALYCDIIDEAGAIATIATILAASAISIKNIGIIHNREFEAGALRIEFYEEESRQKALTLLNRHHYCVTLH